MTSRPSSWTITITVAVSSPGSDAPFELHVDSPVTIADVQEPVSLILRATARIPVVVQFGPNVFTARLAGAGALDVVGPICQERFSFTPPTQSCAADPAIVPIGVSYGDVATPKATGPVISSTAIHLLLRAGALQSGTYRLVEAGRWRVASEGTLDLHPVSITIDFNATGPR